ncbi:MAG: hypothetical protein WD334_03480, partial [Chitinophagales bacterium]
IPSIMEKEIKIKVKDVLSVMLNSREAAIMIFDEIKQKNLSSVEFDFTDVEFMSRSFADQFYKESNKVENNTAVQIVVSNATEAVRNVLHTVAKTQNKTNRSYNKLPVFKFSNASSLKDYLLSV